MKKLVGYDKPPVQAIETIIKLESGNNFLDDMRQMKRTGIPLRILDHPYMTNGPANTLKPYELQAIVGRELRHIEKNISFTNYDPSIAYLSVDDLILGRKGIAVVRKIQQADLRSVYRAEKGIENLRGYRLCHMMNNGDYLILTVRDQEFPDVQQMLGRGVVGIHAQVQSSFPVTKNIMRELSREYKEAWAKSGRQAA